MKTLEIETFYLQPSNEMGERRLSSSTMSTDSEEEVLGPNDSDGIVFHIGENKSPLRRSSSSLDTFPTLLITANVGSIFEDPEILIPIWKSEVIQHIRKLNPSFVAIHFQEVGGKNIHDGIVNIVQSFATDLVELTAKLGYHRHCVFFDTNYKCREKFTALGSFYLAHETLDAEIYNFKTKSYENLEESHYIVGSMDEDSLDFVEKHKFPLQFFPGNRLSRKGYIRTRFRIHGTPLDLINIHLIHDASNFVSCETSPSVYCEFRRKALEYMLDRVHHDDHVFVPYFIFGDFNFRLEGKKVLHRLSSGLQKEQSEKDLVLFKDEEDQVHLTLGNKAFELEKHEETFIEEWTQWTQYDREKGCIGWKLSEMPLGFPPTYPFEENPNEGRKYLRTRCPAWCDRILFSHQTKLIMHQENAGEDRMQNNLQEGEVIYDIIGKDVCMGDHKPVFLRFNLCPNISNVGTPGSSISSSNTVSRQSESPTLSSPNSQLQQQQQQQPQQPQEQTQQQQNRPRIESPTYTDLMTSTAPCTRYIDIDSSRGVKLFKETTV